MIRPLLALVLTVAVSWPAFAAEPDVQPGQWKYTNTTKISGAGMDLPEQRQTNTHCVTESDIAEAETFMDDAERCEIAQRSVEADAMSYTMICPDQQGGEMRVQVDMQLMGDRVRGQSEATMQMNGQSMDVVTQIEGRRVGDC